MGAAANIPVAGPLGAAPSPAGSASPGHEDVSVARNLGRMFGHIAAAIRTPVAPADAAPCRCCGDVVARRIERCDAPGPSGTTLRRTVVDEIVAPAPCTTTLREHHAS